MSRLRFTSLDRQFTNRANFVTVLSERPYTTRWMREIIFFLQILITKSEGFFKMAVFLVK